MKKRTLVSIVLLLLLSTITTQQELVFSTFNLKKINIENNALLSDEDIKKILFPIYEKNLLFLRSGEIETILASNSLIDSFNIRKNYPSTLNITIYEKKPIAILFDKTNKFYLSEKIDLIEFNKLKNQKGLPHVFSDYQSFKNFYLDLKKMDFPFYIIKKYTLFESNRWDLETKNNKIIKLPIKNYKKSLKNYLNLRNKKGFKKYQVFDYRIKNQLILK